MRILVVDDDSDFTLITEQMLVSHGYSVAIAHSGPDALAQIAACMPDLVVLDIMMPEMSGMQVLERLKGDRATLRLPVILCTAKGCGSDVINGYCGGAQYYITKPFTARQLLYGIELLLTSPDPAHP